MKRSGGFPRINRPAPPEKSAASVVEAKLVEAAAQQAPLRTGFPRLPVRPVPPAPMKYDAPHATTRPALPHLPTAGPIDDYYGDEDATDMDASDSGRPGDLFAEPLDQDPDDAPVITVLLRPPPRPEPTVLHPNPASRRQPPPLTSPRQKPSFLPPALQHAPENSNSFFTAFEDRHAYSGGFPRATPAPAANAEAKHPEAILPPLPEQPRVSMNVSPKFDKNGRPQGPKVALKRHVAPQPLSPDDMPFD